MADRPASGRISMTPAGHRISVVGHVSKDVVTIPGRPPRVQLGGSVYYVPAALAALLDEVVAITRLAASDSKAVGDAFRRLGVTPRIGASRETTEIEIVYEAADLARRRQRITRIADPFRPDDANQPEVAAYCLGPLIGADIPVGFIEAVAGRGVPVALDVQGFTRQIEPDGIRLVRPPGIAGLLAPVDILKADIDEARALTGRTDLASAARALAEFGAREVLVTAGERGSVVYCEGRLWPIPAIRPRRRVDATGCGDSYLAGYLHHRLCNSDPPAAGRFAAALASLKLENYGPFRGSAAAVAGRAGQAA